MAQPSVQPTLATLLALAKQDVLYSINCIAVGTIQAFDAVTQKAKVAINYKRIVRDGTGAVSEQDYPPLTDIPVIIVGGGGTNLTFPITAGDGCIVFFNDRDLDAWLYNGKVVPPNSGRLHSFSDAIALVGIRAFPDAIASYDADNPTLDAGAALLSLKNDVTDLKSVINGLIDVIKALTTSNAAVGVPCTISVASQAALTAYKTTVGGLLK